MVNKFKAMKREEKMKEMYDFIDKGGKGWVLKKGESLDDLKKRAAGGK
jgi:hypothetical protein